jgi:2-methylcitrate dehydratase PrpD
MDDLDAWKKAACERRGLTRALAAFISELRPDAVPADTQAVLGRALIDAIGCGLYGLTTPWGRTIRDFAREQGGPPETGLWGSQTRISACNSVLASGTAIHSFDFDDHSRAKIHPGAVVIPVALSLAERCGADGATAMTAIAAGYETMNRVSLAANPARARMRGWHLTGTAGTFGAAAAASVILDLDADTTASALGLAGTQSAGTWAFTSDGSMSKRLHPGRAAQAGVTAALLAQRGFVGPRHVLEADDGGFLFVMSDSPRPALLTAELGSVWHTDQTCFKPHACCGSNHACIDAALALMRERSLDVAEIDRIIAGIPAVVKTQTGFDYRGDSVLNAQMSLRYNIAVAMLDGRAYLDQFAPERIAEPRVFDLSQRVEIEIDSELDRAYPEIYGGRVTLITRSGETLSRRVDHSRGMPENPMSHSEVEDKYLSLATGVVGSRAAHAILELASNAFTATSLAPLNDALTHVETTSSPQLASGIAGNV